MLCSADGYATCLYELRHTHMPVQIWTFLHKAVFDLWRSVDLR